MCDSKLPDELRSLIDEFTTELQSNWEDYSVDGLKESRDANRDYMQKHNFQHSNHSDFELLFRYERILSDSIEVSSIIFPII